MEGLELICFQIISFSGSARSSFMEAIKAAKKGDFDKASELMDEGDKNLSESHHVHAKLIQQEAAGEPTEVNLLLVHAEDQMMSAETVKLLVRELIDLYTQLL